LTRKLELKNRISIIITIIPEWIGCAEEWNRKQHQ
jgi:hypothetical protein